MWTYLKYLNQAMTSVGLPPDGRHWDTPCDQFKESAKELVRLGYARRRWIFFGPVGITWKGLEYVRKIALDSLLSDR